MSAEGYTGNASTGHGFKPAKRTDERCNNGPEVVIRPSEADNDEELPLIPSHPDLLDLHHVLVGTWPRSFLATSSQVKLPVTHSIVQDASFSLVDGVNSALR